jgi:hypothetical protein
MESISTEIELSLMTQLEKKGIEQSMIPLFIRDLVGTVYSASSLEDISQINDRLHLLGWIGIEMDYHTLQLAKACFENWRE